LYNRGRRCAWSRSRPRSRAADLKFLRYLPRARVRNFKSVALEKLSLGAPLCFRSSRQRGPQGFANDGKGALVGECYKATVNEPETITEAKPFCSVHSRSRLRIFGSRLSARAHVERS
jgi:hypothetical protein